jgi:small subunit ribosomal protein S9
LATKTEETIKTEKITKIKEPPKEPYIHVVGRRRTAQARVRLYPHKKGDILVNDLPIEQYFLGEMAKRTYLEPLRTCNVIGKYLITIKVNGSGKQGQLGAVVHGISRALIELDQEKFRPIIKDRGFLTRDSRMRERRKVGMGGKARRRKQSPKR